MPSIDQKPIQAAQSLAREWSGADPHDPAALYLSAGSDTRALTLTHPAVLAKQSGRMLEEMSFYVYVDQSAPCEDPALNFTDSTGRTQINTVDVVDHPVGPFDGYLLSINTESTEMPARKISVLRVRAQNDEFAALALAEGWHPHCVISVCDGCNGFGGNTRCESKFSDAATSIQCRLKPSWIITDHLPGSTAQGGDDPKNGDVIRSTEPNFGFVAEQVAFLSTGWRGTGLRDKGNHLGNLYGGARLFEFRTARRQATR